MLGAHLESTSEEKNNLQIGLDRSSLEFLKSVPVGDVWASWPTNVSIPHVMLGAFMLVVEAISLSHFEIMHCCFLKFSYSLMTYLLS